MFGSQSGNRLNPKFYYHFKEGLYFVSTGGVNITSFHSVKSASDMVQALNATFNDCGGNRSEVERHTSAIAKAHDAIDTSGNAEQALGG